MTAADTAIVSQQTSQSRPPRRSIFSRLSAGHLVMIVAALVALVANYSVLRARDASIRVAIAAVDLRAGSAVTPDAVTFTDISADDELVATLLEPDRTAGVIGWIASADIAAGDLIRASDLVEPSAPSDQRAMSIPVEPAKAVGGALQPGDRVDVIEVQQGSADYVVTAAEVLAVSDSGAARGLGGLGSFSITVAVDDVTALRLAAAIEADRLQVVRSTGALPASAPAYSPPEAPDAPGPILPTPDAAPAAEQTVSPEPAD